VLEDVDAKRSFDGTTPVLTVTGSAVNQSEERRIAPQLRVLLRDEDGKKVQEWTDSLSVTSLGAGERVEFSSRFEAPPVETYRLTVTFAPLPGEETEGGETIIEATDAAGALPAANAVGAPLAEPAGDADAGAEEPGWNGGDGQGGPEGPPEDTGDAEAGHN
jgi:hypothetical protein